MTMKSYGMPENEQNTISNNNNLYYFFFRIGVIRIDGGRSDWIALMETNNIILATSLTFSKIQSDESWRLEIYNKKINLFCRFCLFRGVFVYLWGFLHISSLFTYFETCFHSFWCFYTCDTRLFSIFRYFLGYFEVFLLISDSSTHFNSNYHRNLCSIFRCFHRTNSDGAKKNSHRLRRRIQSQTQWKWTQKKNSWKKKTKTLHNYDVNEFRI